MMPGDGVSFPRRKMSGQFFGGPPWNDMFIEDGIADFERNAKQSEQFSTAGRGRCEDYSQCEVTEVISSESSTGEASPPALSSTIR